MTCLALDLVSFIVFILLQPRLMAYYVLNISQKTIFQFHKGFENAIINNIIDLIY